MKVLSESSIHDDLFKKLLPFSEGVNVSNVSTRPIACDRQYLPSSKGGEMANNMGDHMFMPIERYNNEALYELHAYYMHAAGEHAQKMMLKQGTPQQISIESVNYCAYRLKEIVAEMEKRGMSPPC